MPLNHEEAVLSLRSDPLILGLDRSALEDEVIALIGDDDPLAVALIIDEALATPVETASTAIMDPDAGEPCRLETPCAGNEPLAGNGRCMTCGAHRKAPVSDTEAVEALPIVNMIPAEQPHRPGTVETVTARLKQALGLTDAEGGNLIGVSRPTFQAYANGRLPEIIDGVRAEYMLRAVRKRLAVLAKLEDDLKTLIAVSD